MSSAIVDVEDKSNQPPLSNTIDGAHQRLVERLLRIFDKEPAEWTLAEYTLMASQLPEPAREAAIYLMWEAEKLAFEGLALYYRMRVASRIDWQALVNPPVRTSWLARIRGRKFAAELRSQKDALLGQHPSR